MLDYREIPETDELPDGVYIGLPDARYFKAWAMTPRGPQKRLGSSDMVTLHFQGEGFWWKSPCNPDTKDVDDDTPAKRRGRASHALFCEGADVYRERYVAGPDLKDYPGALTSQKQIEALYVGTDEAPGPGKPKGSSKWLKPQWAQACAVDFPEAVVWENVMADFRATVGDREVIEGADHRMLMVLLNAARRTKEVADLLFNESVPALGEVAVLWTDSRGIARRAKLDRLFKGLIMDLKNLGNWSGRALQYAVGEYMARYGLDIQRADYDDARVILRAHVENGDVYGGTFEQLDYLADEVAPVEEWDWLWLFNQMGDVKGRAPVIFPVMDMMFEGEPDAQGARSRSYLYNMGKKKLDAALNIFEHNVALFGFGEIPNAKGGPSEPWVRVDDLHYVNEAYSPHIGPLPHWIEHVTPSPETESRALERMGGEGQEDA